MKLSATNQEDETYRISRLGRVAAIWMLHSTRLDWLIKQDFILALHDHKGCLNVTWESEPQDEFKQMITDIWKLEFEYDIEHAVGKKQL